MDECLTYIEQAYIYIKDINNINIMNHILKKEIHIDMGVGWATDKSMDYLYCAKHDLYKHKKRNKRGILDCIDVAKQEMLYIIKRGDIAEDICNKALESLDMLCKAEDCITGDAVYG